MSNYYGKQGVIFGKIMIGLALFILLWVYVYHHGDNHPPVIMP